MSFITFHHLLTIEARNILTHMGPDAVARTIVDGLSEDQTSYLVITPTGCVKSVRQFGMVPGCVLIAVVDAGSIIVRGDLYLSGEDVMMRTGVDDIAVVESFGILPEGTGDALLPLLRGLDL